MLVSLLCIPSKRRMLPSIWSSPIKSSVPISATKSHFPLVVCTARTSGKPVSRATTRSVPLPSISSIISALTGCPAISPFVITLYPKIFPFFSNFSSRVLTVARVTPTIPANVDRDARALCRKAAIRFESISSIMSTRPR